MSKPQYLKSLNTINLQPTKVNSRIINIILLDIAGKNNEEIGEMVGLTPARVSVIRNSPLYKERLEEERKVFTEKFKELQAKALIAGDLVEAEIKDACLDAAKKKIDLINKAQSEFVQNAAASDILGIGGYMKKTQKTTTIIEVDPKTAERWDRVLSGEGEQKQRITVTQEETE